METSPKFLIKILQTLAIRYGMSCTIEELISLLAPVFNVSSKLTNNKSAETENQARLLEALIFLNDWGYIFLNSDNDESSITIKGLIRVNDKVFCN